jgi:hypothetical protein
VHVAPVWCVWPLCSKCGSHMSPSASQMVPYGSNTVNMAHIEHTAPTWPPYDTCGSHMAPSTHGSIWLPYMVHVVPPRPMMTPIWCCRLLQLPHGPHMAHVAPRCILRLPYDAQGSHMAPIWCRQHHTAHETLKPVALQDIPAHRSIHVGLRVCAFRTDGRRDKGMNPREGYFLHHEPR